MFFRRKKEESLEEKLDYKITRLNERIVILDAIAFAIENHRLVAEIILESENRIAAKEKLCQMYEFSEEQSQAIVDMRMKALTKEARKQLLDEIQECRSRFEELQIEKVNLETGHKEEK